MLWEQQVLYYRHLARQAAEVATKAQKECGDSLAKADWIERCASLKACDKLILKEFEPLWKRQAVEVEGVSFERLCQSFISVKANGQWRDCGWFEEVN